MGKYCRPKHRIDKQIINILQIKKIKRSSELNLKSNGTQKTIDIIKNST